jgi:hypothetical protein
MPHCPYGPSSTWDCFGLPWGRPRKDRPLGMAAGLPSLRGRPSAGSNLTLAMALHMPALLTARTVILQRGIAAAFFGEGLAKTGNRRVRRVFWRSSEERSALHEGTHSVLAITSAFLGKAAVMFSMCDVNVWGIISSTDSAAAVSASPRIGQRHTTRRCTLCCAMTGNGSL